MAFLKPAPLQASRRALIRTAARCGAFLLGSSSAWAKRAALEIDLPTLRYAGDWQPYPQVMESMASLLRLRTRISPRRDPSVVDLKKRAKLFDTPFLYVAGQAALPELTVIESQDLRRFVDYGGLLVFDDATGGHGRAFRQSVQAWVAQLFPGSQLKPLPEDHVLFRSFYLVKHPSGRTAAESHCFAIQEEGRIKVLYLPNDLGGALARNAQGYIMPCSPGAEVQREWARRFAINLLLYATCTDYKSDPAHVETLLRRRRWQ